MGTSLPRRLNLLWVLAALLGIAAIHGTFRAIHHPEPSREIMGHFAGVTAGYATSIAEGRLQALGREAFAPVSPWGPGPLAETAVIETLVRGARDAERCHCRPMIAATEFFHFDLIRKTVDLRTPAAAGSPADSVLQKAVLGPHVGDGSLALHFVSPAAGDVDAILLSFQYDSSGRATGGYGLVTSGRSLAEQIFGGNAGFDARASLEVATASGLPLFRTPGPELPYHTTIHPRGLLGELSVTSGLGSASAMLASLRSISRDQLWFSGVLLVCAILVITIAAVYSRREALLARARSDFIAGVSHELRMPLAQILLASETLALEREPDTRRQLGLATSIVREARRLAGLVDNVLLVARSGAVAPRPTLSTVNVGELFAEVEESVHLAVEDAGQRLEVVSPPGLAVQGDRQLLRQALTNLIDNAIKYGERGQTIRLEAKSVDGGVRLEVENDGPGIPPALRARLFEPYERLARDQTSERTGSGLGLAVVAQIARACGGRVWLEDGNPAGTRAVVALRVAP
jgi:signal transduction histidine kinase